MTKTHLKGHLVIGYWYLLLSQEFLKKSENPPPTCYTPCPALWMIAINLSRKAKGLWRNVRAPLERHAGNARPRIKNS